MNPVVRPAKSQDIEALLVLFESLVANEADFEFNASRQRRGFQMMIDDAAHCVVMTAEQENQLIGLCTMQLQYSTAMGGQIGILENFIVDHHFRGQGIGQALLDSVEAWAAQRRVLRIDLMVDGENKKAQRFYKSRGWVQTNLLSCFKIPG